MGNFDNRREVWGVVVAMGMASNGSGAEYEDLSRREWRHRSSGLEFNSSDRWQWRRLPDLVGPLCVKLRIHYSLAAHKRMRFAPASTQPVASSMPLFQQTLGLIIHYPAARWDVALVTSSARSNVCR